jgi:post-segregation antitoxin (ccd killing protein)
LFVFCVLKHEQSRGTGKHVEKQNITLFIPKDVPCEAKHLAVDRGISLSGFLVEALEERVKRLSEMRWAAERQRTLLRRGLRLGTKGKVRWRREDLHVR